MGGGVRGVIQVTLRDRLPPARSTSLFAGTSTGAITAACQAFRIDLNLVLDLYRRQGKRIFKARPVLWRNPASWAKSWIGRGLLGPIYSAEPLATALKTIFHDATLGDVKGAFLMAMAYDCTARQPLTFKSWKPEHAAIPVWQAVLCSCSAPIYFPEQRLTVEGVQDRRIVDGGMVANDPSREAYAEACLLAQMMGMSPAEVQIVSFGTGRCATPIRPDNWGALKWARHLTEAFMDTSEAAHYSLREGLGARYVRLQPPLPESLGAMDGAENIPELQAAALYWGLDSGFDDMMRATKMLAGPEGASA